MSTRDDLKGIFNETMRVMETSLDVTDQFAALRDAATAKGLDWGQLKALAKAHVLDARDESGESNHVEKIVEKADFALAYADMLGLAKMNANKSIPDGSRRDEGSGSAPPSSSTPPQSAPTPAAAASSQLSSCLDEAAERTANAEFTASPPEPSPEPFAQEGTAGGRPTPNTIGAVLPHHTGLVPLDPDDDLDLPTFLRRGHPDCIVGHRTDPPVVRPP